MGQHCRYEQRSSSGDIGAHREQKETRSGDSHNIRRTKRTGETTKRREQPGEKEITKSETE